VTVARPLDGAEARSHNIWAQLILPKPASPGGQLMRQCAT